MSRKVEVSQGFEGEVYEGGDGKMLLKTPRYIQEPASFVNKEMFPFNKKRVKVTVIVKIEQH